VIPHLVNRHDVRVVQRPPPRGPQPENVGAKSGLVSGPVRIVLTADPIRSRLILPGPVITHPSPPRPISSEQYVIARRCGCVGLFGPIRQRLRSSEAAIHGIGKSRLLLMPRLFRAGQTGQSPRVTPHPGAAPQRRHMFTDWITALKSGARFAWAKTNRGPLHRHIRSSWSALSVATIGWFAAADHPSHDPGISTMKIHVTVDKGNVAPRCDERTGDAIPNRPNCHTSGCTQKLPHPILFSPSQHETGKCAASCRLGCICRCSLGRKAAQGAFLRDNAADRSDCNCGTRFDSPSFQRGAVRGGTGRLPQLRP